ncbi:MAG: preprotein translocase subunit SecE [Gemmatimonadetes bacterium]|jgi:preprotein translocase subunit SecE|nr:MAG: preprotein translocase subunit SecE [Gemmatimonadota bacterium]
MAVDVARPPQGAPPAPAGNWFTRTFASLVAFYHGVIAEMRKVTWPDRGQVQQATIAIIIFVLALALFITVMDWLLSLILVRGVPSLFSR